MLNKNTTLILVLSLFIFNALSYSGDIYKVDKKKLSMSLNENSKYVVSTSFYRGPGISLERNTTYGDDYVIGPEVPVMQGYYDWQHNGPCPHYIFYTNDNEMHAVYMVSTDSLDLSGSRRTHYAFSTDGGATWTDLGEVPNIRSGFPSLTVGNTGASNGVAVIGNHYQPGSALTAGMHVDISPGIGVFTSTPWDFNTTNFIWPNVQTMLNGNIMVSANSYQGAAATDTGIVTYFNPNTNSWIGNPHKFVSTATDQTNMRWIGATGPNGKGIFVLDAINDQGNSLSNNRIFYWTTTDNGTTWSNQNVLFESFVDNTGDTVTAWLGIDATYDDAGNFYVAYNTIADSFQTAKVWVTKNGDPAAMVAHNQDIPGAAYSLVFAMGNVITMDWPSLSISDDGQYVFCSYTVCKQNDTVNGYNSEDVYYSFSQTSTLDFTGNGPIQVTSGRDDERYVSLNRKAITAGADTYVLHMVYMKDPQPGSAAFNDGAPVSLDHLIYRKITQAHIIGIKKISSEIPGKFALSQNYPNPFNPVTTIMFDVPEKNNVKLVVYDLLGRQVEVLVNKEVQPGSYTVKFDGSNLPSGVFFCKMTAGNYTDVRKMVLVK